MNDTRTEYASGLFYLGYKKGLERDVRKYLEEGRDKKTKARGILVPHAGYEYSGSVAGKTYGSIKSASRALIIGPNHSGFGSSIAIEESGSWKTPLGSVEIDEELAEAIIKRDASVKVSPDAHRLEHAVEVQLPFLQEITEGRLKMVPMTLKKRGRAEDLRRLGESLAEAIEDVSGETLVVVTSDLNHYEPLPIVRHMDKKYLDAVKMMDPLEPIRVAYSRDMTVCGVFAVAVGMYTLRALGARKADVIAYDTSATFSQDTSSVVGYGGVVFT